MKNYSINGFLVKVTEAQDKKIRQMLNKACILAGKEKYSDSQDTMKERGKFIYSLHETALRTGKAQRLDDYYKIDRNGDKIPGTI